MYIHCFVKVITKLYKSTSKETTYVRGKIALLNRAKERAMRLLSYAIEVFRQAELRDGETLYVEPLDDDYDDLLSVTPNTSDTDDTILSGTESSSESDEDL